MIALIRMAPWQVGHRRGGEIEELLPQRRPPGGGLGRRLAGRGNDRRCTDRGGLGVTAHERVDSDGAMRGSTIPRRTSRRFIPYIPTGRRRARGCA